MARTNPDSEMDALIRDLTKAHPLPKSEVRTRILDLKRRWQLETQLKLYKGWHSWVTSGGGTVTRFKIEENIADIEGQLTNPDTKGDK